MTFIPLAPTKSQEHLVPVQPQEVSSAACVCQRVKERERESHFGVYMSDVTAQAQADEAEEVVRGDCLA